MKPGDLVKLGRGGSARLYGGPDMDDGDRFRKPDITAVVNLNEVGLVVGQVIGKNGHQTYLLLFGEKLGWRDELPWMPA